MQTVKKKWQMLKTYHRVRKLWNEYKEVAQIDDFTLVTEKLSAFLDQFVSSYRDLAPEENFSIDLDKIYGDCSQILLNLLDLVEKEAEKSSNTDSHENIIIELVNKALNVAELILHDEKYRLIVKETPNLLKRILSLLDTLKTAENKKLVLRVISVLGNSTQNQLEIGKLEGFKKILKLFAEDKQLTREILQTLQHFLDVSHPKQEHEELQKLARGEFFSGKLGGVISDLTKIVSVELQRFWTPSMDDNNNPDKPYKQDELLLAPHFLPSKEALTLAIELLRNPPQPSIDPALNTSNNNNNNHNNNNNNTSTTNNNNNPITTTEDEIVKEFMRVQGAFTTLTSTLEEAALTVQLDLVETISKLIFRSQETQVEF